MKKDKVFSVRWGPNISTIIIEVHNFEMVARPKVRTSLHRAVESHIQRGKKDLEQLKGVNHGNQRLETRVPTSEEAG